MTPTGTGGSIGDTEAAILLAGEDLLSLDNVPDENQQVECFSCGENMLGLFCHACGQKNDDYRRSIFSLLTEAFASVFSLENRMWRTWMMLWFKPGKVSREYADGKRTNWTSPVRIYLALSIMLFGYMSITETRIFSVRTDIIPKAGFEGPIDTLNDNSVRLSPDFGFFRRQAELDKLNEGTDFKRVSRLIKGISRQAFKFDDNLASLNLVPDVDLLKSSESWPNEDTPPIQVYIELGDESESPLTREQQAIKIYTEKVAAAIESYNLILATTKDPETIADRILAASNNGIDFDITNESREIGNENIKLVPIEAITSLDDQLSKLGLSRSQIHTLPVETRTGFNFDIGQGQINGVKLSKNDVQNLTEEILRNPALLNEGVSKYLPRIMFLMMPFAALIGLVFIRDRKRALLYDHLVHATYIHAVTFAFLLSLILVAQWTPLKGMAKVFLLGIALYLPLSAKGMFKRGWFKTIFASYSIALVYGLIMFMIITALTAQSISEAIKAEQGLI